MSSGPAADAVPQQWTAAITALTVAPSKNWVSPFLAMLPVSGMAISTLGTVFANETLIASDGIAGRLDELQFDLGEGPCWDAINRGRPVLETDVPGRGRQVWPALSDAIADDDVQGVFAFPLLLGPIGVGAIDLYTSTRQSLTSEDVLRMTSLAASISHLVLGHAIAHADTPMESEEANPRSRRIVHQATGAVMAQLGITPEEALLVLQGRAFADGRRVRDVADDVIGRRVVVTRQQDEIEDTP